VLEDIRIRGLGVIDDAVLELSRGLTVLTGETGAGKTMVVTGLDLLFGGRSDSGRVREGVAAAVVEGRIAIDPTGPVAARAAEAGAELDDAGSGTAGLQSLLVSRTVTAEGRSRAVLGGRSVPVSVLAELADDLVARHGQNDQQRLLRPARQRAALDRYAGEAALKPLAAFRAAYDRLRELDDELAELVTRARERAQEADLLRFGLAEIERTAPESGEDRTLSAEVERLSHADALRTAATTAHAALLGDPGAAESTELTDAVGLVAVARRAIDQVRAHDAELAALSDRLSEVGYLLADVATDLAAYAESVDADPLRLATAQERQAALSALTKKYGDTVDDVLEWAKRAAIRLASLESDDERIDSLRAERAEVRAELARLAAEVSAARRAAADRFGAAVTTELRALAMPHAVVTVPVTQQEIAESGQRDALEVDGRHLVFGPTGIDDVEILLRPHPGAPARPIQRGASGGELSRVMLAIEVVFAGADPVPTFVFDEVDAGVGGTAAVEVGRRLATLAAIAQVLVVTHLPQVAAFADRHLVVEKSSAGLVTRSGVTMLDHAGRVRELSRMLAGQAESESAQAHAEELLEAAAAVRPGG
jgi:DNA repair protein RecN (Recombination protein N)